MSANSFPVPRRRIREHPFRWPPRPAFGRPGTFELSRLAAWTIVVALTGVSLALRLRGIHAALWADEGISAGIASHPLTQIPHLLREDGSPPLYYLLLHVWIAWQGRSVVALHVLSLLFAQLAVPVAYWATARLYGRRTGLIGAGLIAGLPYLTQYAEETRMYSLLTLLSIIVAASFLQAFVYRRRGYLPVFAVAMCAALYTHNWSLYLAAVSVLAVGFCVWRAEPPDRRALVRDALIAYGIVAVLFAPWLPTLLYQARHTGAPWTMPPVVWSLTQGLYSLVGDRSSAVAILLAAGSGLVALRRASAAERRTVTGVLALLVLGFGTLLLAWAYAKVTPSWAIRYLAVIVGPLLIVAALGFARAGRIGIVALVLIACFWLLDPISDSRSHKSNVGAVAAVVRHQLGPDPLVIATQPEQIPTLAYYLRRVTRFASPVGPAPDPRVVDWRNALNRLRRASVAGSLMPLLGRVQAGQRVLLVISENLKPKPAYMTLINHDSRAWVAALRADPHFRPVLDAAPQQHGAGVAVRGLLFERVS